MGRSPLNQYKRANSGDIRCSGDVPIAAQSAGGDTGATAAGKTSKYVCMG